MLDARRKALRKPWDGWNVVCPSRNNHLISEVVANRCVQLKEAGLVPGQTLDRYALSQRRLKRSRVSFNVVDDFIFLHEAVRVVSLIVKAWQFALPVRGHKTKCIPAF